VLLLHYESQRLCNVIAIVFYVWHDATKQNPKNQDKEEEDVQ
jgi:hypothetical protein